MNDIAKRQRWAAQMVSAAQQLEAAIREMRRVRAMYDANGYSGTLTPEHLEGPTTDHLTVDTVANGLYTFELVNQLMTDNNDSHLNNLYRLVP